jgi:glycosyltransferase involved in cell wall biosynthesis
MALRIGMILDTDFPPDSRVENEALSLIEAGFEVYLFSLSFEKTRKNENIRGINVVRYPASKITYKLSALAYSTPLYHQIVRKKISHFLRTNDIQVIHVHDMQIARGVWMANMNKLPIILDLHENRPEIMKYYRHVNTLQGKALISPENWEHFQNKYIGLADGVIVVTPQAKEVITNQGLKNTEDLVVVPNTVHPDVFNNYPIEKDIVNRFKKAFTVLYLGDTGLRRGTDTAIMAASILKEKIPELKMVFVGSNTEDVVLKKMVSSGDLNEIVIFEGWQDVSLFPSYITGSSVCISPLKRNKHHDTTYANKIFQYMATGRPLVVSDCPPQAEVVINENVGLVHEAENEQDMADKIYSLYQNKGLREQMGNNARNAILNNWNWNETSKDLIRMYKSIEAKMSN